MMLNPPFSIWLNPWTRVNCSLGAISEVDAVIAGLRKPPTNERTNISK